MGFLLMRRANSVSGIKSKLNLKIHVAKESKKWTTFYLYINSSQTKMTLKHSDFAGFCGLLTKGQVGLPLDKISIEGCLYEKP